MKRLRGFAIVSAIFILVVLAALGAFILNISSSQQIGSALDVQGVRAYQAARAGVEWGLFQAQSTAAYNFGYASIDPNQRRCPGGGLSSTDSLAIFDFTVTVVCTATTDANNGPTIYALTSTACSQPVTGWTANTVACPNTANPGALYIERRLTVTF
ncbi:MAG: agglutinin biogenesis protein MshP [Gammaproteobacteria bacterium]|nr:agglutinin biogenesis protein MshP [Rhodocyclaceae bacterium]MBU3909500.1 agglutinin biogenesis protein MshP [Gammaproteobacteria bacterium]MBU3987797.1 agglutinin biogenesis protein MshP [Gammaproteobacteria bacterium]MBU4003163.1 agglutinin biogenesis protein MshP [Gammaproteobacteria bacterium]MBU4022212.1 agglutinin biogenesis protein MshP [Gammaproteobacteria bacterium]